jgi:hypothetical protein
MTYIPEAHQKYDILPLCHSKGGEIFSYSPELACRGAHYASVVCCA